MKKIKSYLIGLSLLVLSACSLPAPIDDGRPIVVATTNIIGDVVAQVGGEEINLIVLLPAGADPHAYEPNSQDLRAIADADMVFINGLGLEDFLEDMLVSAGGNAVIVPLAERGMLAAEHADEDDHTSDDDVGEDAHGHGVDPHVWLDVDTVAGWVAVIADELTALDPDHAALYAARATDYAAELETLEAWIVAEVALLPPARRVLVTNHDSFGYFAAAYEFEIVGAVISGFSTIAEPSAQEIVALQEIVRVYDVPAIFVEVGINPMLAAQVAADTGIVLVALYTGSLSAADGPASSYIELMRYNVSSIVAGLSE